MNAPVSGAVLEMLAAGAGANASRPSRTATRPAGSSGCAAPRKAAEAIPNPTLPIWLRLGCQSG